jgi:hypothetical protein
MVRELIQNGTRSAPRTWGAITGTQSLIYQHVLDDAYCEKGRAIEISATVNRRLRAKGVGDVKELERRRFDKGIEAMRRAVHT